MSKGNDRPPLRSLSRSELAFTMEVSYRTVCRHLKRLKVENYQHGVPPSILQKLGVDQEMIHDARNRAQATARELLEEVDECRECKRLKRLCNDHSGPLSFIHGAQLTLF